LAIVIQQNRKSGGNPPEKEKAGGLGVQPPKKTKGMRKAKKYDQKKKGKKKAAKPNRKPTCSRPALTARCCL
jgi:hypothetical protein